MNATQPAAIVIDQWEILRLGVEKVLSDLDFLVVGSTPRVEDGVFLARSSAAEILIVGKAADLKPNHLLAQVNREREKGSQLKVLFLLERADPAEVAALVNNGADGVLMRSSGVGELAAAISRIKEGERVIAPAVTPGSIGSLHATGELAAGLSPKELEVLAELATGATYDQIANNLVVTKATVKTHLVHVYDKLGVANRNQAVAKAVSLGLLG